MLNGVEAVWILRLSNIRLSFGMLGKCSNRLHTVIKFDNRMTSQHGGSSELGEFSDNIQ